MGQPIDRRELAGVVEVLRHTLAAIDAGEITSELDHTAYLGGAADALALLAAPEGDRPETKQTGRPRALTADQVRVARRMRGAGESVSTICTALRVARSTLYRALGDAEQETEPAMIG